MTDRRGGSSVGDPQHPSQLLGAPLLEARGKPGGLLPKRSDFMSDFDPRLLPLGVA